jgi:DSF synthase
MLVRTGKTLTAEELYELGIVHILAEPGQGIEATRRYIQKNSSRHAAHFRMYRAMKSANPITLKELDDIVWLWVEACMTLDQHSLAVMRRLVNAQSKMSAAA